MLACFVSWVDDGDDHDDHGFHNSGLDHDLKPLQEAMYAKQARRFGTTVQSV